MTLRLCSSTRSPSDEDSTVASALTPTGVHTPSNALPLDASELEDLPGRFCPRYACPLFAWKTVSSVHWVRFGPFAAAVFCGMSCRRPVALGLREEVLALSSELLVLPSELLLALLLPLELRGLRLT